MLRWRLFLMSVIPILRIHGLPQGIQGLQVVTALRQRALSRRNSTPSPGSHVQILNLQREALVVVPLVLIWVLQSFIHRRILLHHQVEVQTHPFLKLVIQRLDLLG